jgi:hypothetical protein
METNFNLPVVTAGMTKTQISIVADQSIKNVLEQGNVLEAVEAISVMEAFIKQVKSSDEFKSYALDEIAKHGKLFTSASGAKIAPMESGITYHFDFCNDSELNELIKQQEELEIKISDRKAFLKTLPLSGMEIRKDDELIEIYPPVKTSTSTYKVTLSK